jgi:hypothetical protein
MECKTVPIFTNAVVKKLIEVEDGETVEAIDVRLQVQLLPGEKYEDVRAALMKRLDSRFNELFYAELGVMPERLAEGEVWRQRSLFADEVMQEAVGFFRDHNATLSTGRDDDE